MSKTPIFFLGATGYIGGSVLSRLLSHPNQNSFDITVLVRDSDKAKKLERLGVKAVVGSFKDMPLVEQLAENAHVVFSTADADDLGAANALLAGLKRRHEKTDDIPVLIHTSGVGFLTAGDAGTKGLGISEKIFSDDDPDDLERSLPPEAFHRNVDLAIIQADNEGYLKSYIVAPGIIWAPAKNLLVDAGISNNISKGLHALIQVAIARGTVGIVGKGQALWPYINIDEQASLFIQLYDAIVSNPEQVGHGRNGFYFGENGEVTWYNLSKAIAKSLVKRGLIQTDEPSTFTPEELVKYFGSEFIGNLFGSNSRARSPHSRSLGWAPKLTIQDLLDDVDAEVDAALQNQKA
ncbi:NAD-P-binding protein [Irpex lacteus]|nr:NAD-P-binding protein [Irpex lacteus]